MSTTMPFSSSRVGEERRVTAKVAPCSACAGPKTAPRNEWAIMMWSETSTANTGDLSLRWGVGIMDELAQHPARRAPGCRRAAPADRANAIAGASSASSAGSASSASAAAQRRRWLQRGTVRGRDAARPGSTRAAAGGCGSSRRAAPATSPRAVPAQLDAPSPRRRRSASAVASPAALALACKTRSQSCRRPGGRREAHAQRARQARRAPDRCRSG